MEACYRTFKCFIFVLVLIADCSAQQQSGPDNERSQFTLHTIGRNQDFSTGRSPDSGGATSSSAATTTSTANFGGRNHNSLYSAHPNENRGGESYGSDFEAGRRQRLDGITVLLQRVGDRLLAMEAAQVQRAERIDSVHYRMTRLEVSEEEQKSAISELANAVRHRLMTSDFEREKIRESLDALTVAANGLSNQNTRILAFLEARQATESAAIATQESSASIPRLRAVMTSLMTVRNLAQQLKQETQQINANLTQLNNITSSMGFLVENGITKSFLRSSLAEALRFPAIPSFYGHHMMSGAMPVLSGRANKPRQPVDCHEVQQRLLKNSEAVVSGLYLIQPLYSNRPFFAYCDLKTDGGGWTVLQRRQDGSVEFLREWQDYKYGFGNLAGEFWLGNEHIYAITNQKVYELRVELHDFGQEVALAKYSAFAIGSEEEGYALKLLGHFTGDAGDSLSYHVGQRWSTIDSDSDSWFENNCARDHHGAWWYRACDTSNLNGLYLHGPVPADRQYQGIYWYDFRGPQYSLWKTRMMIRPGGIVTEPVVMPTTPATTSDGENNEETTTDPDEYILIG